MIKLTEILGLLLTIIGTALYKDIPCFKDLGEISLTITFLLSNFVLR